MSIFNKKPDPALDAVPCETCRHLVRLDDANRVRVTNWIFHNQYVEYYCPEHKPPYDSVDICPGEKFYYQEVPARTVRVTKDGKPIKSK